MRLVKFVLAVLLACVVVTDLQADGRLRGRRGGRGESCSSGGCSSGSCAPNCPPGCVPVKPKVTGIAVDQIKAQLPAGGQLLETLASDNSASALAEVNAARAARGLRPYIEDPLLTAGAANAAKFRAERLLAGHTGNDFSALPPGAHARAAGCAAWGQGEGWGSCCTYENHTYAGAAYAVGRDGKRYMHLFVR